MYKELIQLEYGNSKRDERSGKRKRAGNPYAEAPKHQAKCRKPKVATKEINEPSNEDTAVPESPRVVLDGAYAREGKTERAQMRKRPVQTGKAVKSPRLVVSTTAVEGYLDSIDLSLWKKLYRTSKPVVSGFDAIVEFQEQPSQHLRNLYQRCLGHDWQASALDLTRRRAVRSTDFLVSLIGAAIFDRVLSPASSSMSRSSSIYRSPYHEYEAMRYLQELDGFDIESYHQTIKIRTAQNEGCRLDVLRPRAQLKTSTIVETLHEHLSCQSAWSECLANNGIPDAMAEAVLTAVERATRLKAELEASGDEVMPTWYESGQAYDGRRMKPSRVSTDVAVTKSSVINVTLLPGIDRRHPGSPWSVMVPAVVHLSP